MPFGPGIHDYIFLNREYKHKPPLLKMLISIYFSEGQPELV